MSSLSLQVCIATMNKPDDQVPDTINSLINNAKTITADDFLIHYNSIERNDGVVGAYQKLYDRSTADVLAYIHNDVYVYEKGWDEKLMREFDDPAVGLVGWGGALRHGDPNIYKTPYRLQQLGRSGYVSNVKDAEVHGERFTGSREAAVLDGFVLAIRRTLLDKINGWQVLIDGKIDFIAYDYVMCGLAHRHGYKIKVVGIESHHLGGVTSTKMNVDRQAEYDYAHQWCYEHMRDVLPWRCD